MHKADCGLIAPVARETGRTAVRPSGSTMTKPALNYDADRACPRSRAGIRLARGARTVQMGHVLVKLDRWFRADYAPRQCDKTFCSTKACVSSRLASSCN